MNAGDIVLVRDYDSGVWNLSIFSHMDKLVGAESKTFVCLNGVAWRHCIPYIGNESLVGTRGTSCEFSYGMPVLVRNSDEDEWKLRYWISLDGNMNVVTKKLPSDEKLPIDQENPSEQEGYLECQPFENVIGKPFTDIYKKIA